MFMKHVLVVLSAFFILNIEAYGKCQLKDVKVQWTGFKTAKKAGVSGIFKNVKLIGGLGGDGLDALKKLKFEIDTTALESGDAARDLKISKIFFGTMKDGSKITGSIQKVEKGYATARVTMNGVDKDVALEVKLDGNKVTGHGFIDILDFSAVSSLRSLNKACFAKHEGKTWSDAEVTITATCK